MKLFVRRLSFLLILSIFTSGVFFSFTQLTDAAAKTKTVYKTTYNTIHYATITKKDSSKYTDYKRVVIKGENGKQSVKIRYTYQGKKLISKKVVSTKTVSKAKSATVVVGTKPIYSYSKVTHQQSIPYGNQTVYDNINYDDGNYSSAGHNGVRDVTVQNTYYKGILKTSKQIASKTIKNPINQVTHYPKKSFAFGEPFNIRTYDGGHFQVSATIVDIGEHNVIKYTPDYYYNDSKNLESVDSNTLFSNKDVYAILIHVKNLDDNTVNAEHSISDGVFTLFKNNQRINSTSDNDTYINNYLLNDNSAQDTFENLTYKNHTYLPNLYFQEQFRNALYPGEENYSFYLIEPEPGAKLSLTFDYGTSGPLGSIDRFVNINR